MVSTKWSSFCSWPLLCISKPASMILSATITCSFNRSLVFTRLHGNCLRSVADFNLLRYFLGWLWSAFMRLLLISLTIKRHFLCDVIPSFTFPCSLTNSANLHENTKVETPASVCSSPFPSVWDLQAVTHPCVCHDPHSQDTYRDDYSCASGMIMSSLCFSDAFWQR